MCEMKIVTRIVCTVFILIGIQACSGIKVSQDYDQGYNFSGLKTFAWKPNENSEYGLVGNDLVKERIITAIEKNLLAKSYIQIGSGKPDFFISYHVTVEQKISSNGASGSISLGRSSGGGRYRGAGLYSGSEVEAYDEGRLLIDVTDVTSNRLVWRGKSTQRVSGHSSAEKSTALINETVEKMLLQFPPR
jgi:hypothetical protein